MTKAGRAMLRTASALGIALLVAAPGRAQRLDPFEALGFRYVGPPGNKIVAIAGVPGDPNLVYAGTPSGGVFKSVDGGFLWKPIFDGTGVASVGAIAVAESDPRVIWVGTGDAFVRENVSIGNGVYRSTDAGATWTHLGLDSIGRTGRVAIHPTDPNTVFIAAVGRGYAPSQHRGLYRTRDGGRSWERVLFVDESTGAVDVVMEPGNPRVVYAATWTLRMGPGGNETGGPGSAIYRSRDGGSTWTKLSNGLPAGPLGRIGLAISAARPQRVYALISAPDPASGVLWRSEDGGESWSLRSKDPRLNRRAVYFSRFGVFPDDPDELWFLAQSAYHSKDGGETAELDVRIFPDQHDVWIDPRDPRRLMIANDRFVYLSTNRGLGWRSVDLPNGQLYGVSTDRAFPYHLYGHRHDGPGFRGPSNSLRSAEAFGGSPDNRLTIANDDWETLPTGEVGVSIPDPFDADLVWMLTPWSFELFDYPAWESRSVAPWKLSMPNAEAPADRVSGFAIAVSTHTPALVYAASQYVYRSFDRGRSWTAISPDLTARTLPRPTGSWPDGRVFSAVQSLAESPLERGVLWAGTTDGLVQVTRDDGRAWTDVTSSLPGLGPNGVVTSIEPSRHARGVAYLTVDRHKVDDRDPHVFRTSDYGATWRRIVSGIPRTVVSYARVIREDPRRPGLLYLGTEGGLYVSFDDGDSWVPFGSGLPRVPISGIAVQEDFNDLVVSTFGRGFWVLDDITPLQEFAPATATAPLHLFTPRPGYLLGGHRSRTADALMRVGPETPSNAGENPPPGMPINYSVGTAGTGSVTISVLDAEGGVVRTLRGPGAAGVNRVWWGLDRDSAATATPDESLSGTSGQRVEPGSYTVTVSLDGRVAEARITVTPVPRREE